MRLSVSQPLHTAEEAETAIACIEQWPRCDERDDRLIEIAAHRLEQLWVRFGAYGNSSSRGRTVKLIFDSKRMFAVKLNMDRHSRPRQAQDLEDDKIINWHKEVFYALLTCDYIIGSVANADLFRAAMLDRFSNDGTAASMPLDYRCVKVGSTTEPLIEHLLTPGHRARAAAAGLGRNTSPASSLPMKRRI